MQNKYLTGGMHSPSRFRNLRSSEFYETTPFQGEDHTLSRQDLLTTPCYSVKDLASSPRREDPLLELQRLRRHQKYGLKGSRSPDYAASLSNMSKLRASEAEALPPYHQREQQFGKGPGSNKDSGRNIEINLNFDKGHLTLQDLQQLTVNRQTERGLAHRDYDMEKSRWQADKNSLKTQLTLQDSEIQKLNKAVYELRSRLREQEALDTINEKNRKIERMEPDLRTVRSLTKLNTARQVRQNQEYQSQQLRQIQEKTKKLKEMQKQERMTARQLMQIIQKLRDENSGFKKMYQKLHGQPVDMNSELIQTESLTVINSGSETRTTVHIKKPESQKELLTLKEQIQCLVDNEAELKASYEKLVVERSTLVRENIQLKRDLMARRSQVEQENEKLQADISNLADILVEKQMENDKLIQCRQEVLQVHKINDMLRQQLREASNKSMNGSIVEELKAEIEKLIKDVEDIENQKIAVEALLKQSQSQKNQLIRINEEYQSECESSQMKIKQLTMKLEVSLMSLEEFKRRVDQMEIQHEQIKGRMTDRSSKSKESENRMLTLNQEVQRLEKELKKADSELKLNNSLMLELKLLNESLRLKMDEMERQNSRHDYEEELATKDNAIKQLTETLEKVNDQCERLVQEKELLTKQLEESEAELLESRERVEYFSKLVAEKTERIRSISSQSKNQDLKLEQYKNQITEIQGKLQNITKQLEFSKQQNKLLEKQKTELEKVISSTAEKHEKQLKTMFSTNQKIVKNLLQIAQRNYELETEIENMRLEPDAENFLRVNSQMKDMKEESPITALSEGLDETPKKPVGKEVHLDPIHEQSKQEESESFKIVNRVKSIISEMDNAMSLEDSRVHSIEMLETIDKFSRLVANKPKPQHKKSLSNFTKKEQCKDIDISGISLDNEHRVAEPSESMAMEASWQKEKLAKLNDVRLEYEAELQAILRNQQPIDDRTLSELVIQFLKKMYQHPNLPYLIEEAQKFMTDIRSYEKSMEKKICNLQSAVNSYLEKANNMLRNEVSVVPSQTGIESKLPILSQFKSQTDENSLSSKSQDIRSQDIKLNLQNIQDILPIAGENAESDRQYVDQVQKEEVGEAQKEAETAQKQLRVELPEDQASQQRQPQNSEANPDQESDRVNDSPTLDDRMEYLLDNSQNKEIIIDSIVDEFTEEPLEEPIKPQKKESSQNSVKSTPKTTNRVREPIKKTSKFESKPVQPKTEIQKRVITPSRHEKPVTSPRQKPTEVAKPAEVKKQPIKPVTLKTPTKKSGKK